ncbi:hypothetical protein CRG98_010398 [Punica granatum]|uniref:SnoaL-like domain-containing protein n=1 Tax=Punica granatum TaxID=22663 RepID=A0A2I0KLS3_PUNGR|nr:hypothetical protein CRG98_010398 [Punica granatum]
MNRKGLFIEKCRKDDSPTHTEEEEDNNGALQAVLKLYDSIKNRNIMELSEVFGDDCQCGCNFIPFFRSFRGKKQVLAFFSYLMRSLGSNIEFVVQPTLQDGMNVGVSWRLGKQRGDVHGITTPYRRNCTEIGGFYDKANGEKKFLCICRGIKPFSSSLSIQVLYLSCVHNVYIYIDDIRI